MESVNRVVIYDRQPILVSAVLDGLPNRLVLTVGTATLALQGFSLLQVISGHGERVHLFDHVDYASVSLLWLLLGFLVFLQRQANRAGRLFLLASAAGSTFLCLVTLARLNMAYTVVYVAGLLSFAPLLLGFVRAFDGRPRRAWRELVIYVPPILLLWPTASAIASNPTTLLWRLGLLSVAAYLVVAIVQTVYDLPGAASAELAAQQRALLFGLIAGTIPGALVFVIPLVSGGQSLVALGWLPLLVLIFLLAMSYSVLLFEFAEADLIVRRGFVYGVLTLAIVVAYGVLGFLLAAGRASVTSPGGGLSFVAMTILVGAGFTPLRRIARRMVDQLLYGGRKDRWESLQELSAGLGSVMQPNELCEVLARQILMALRLKGAFLLLPGDDGLFHVSNVVVGDQDTDGPTGPPAGTVSAAELAEALGEPPRPLLLVHARPLMASKRAGVPDRFEKLDSLRAALSIPLVTRFGLGAVLCLQGKVGHDAFDADDLELLAPVMRQASVALDNASLFSSLQDKIAEVQSAYVRIAREQEVERARLARELHDGTAQELAGLITLAAVAERQLTEDGAGAGATLHRLRRQAEDAYQGVRRASHALRPLMLDDFGLAPTIESYVDGYREATSINVESEVGSLGDLDRDVELALFRIIQECLENTRKHSGASRVQLQLWRKQGCVTLKVEDNGIGITSAAGPGIGLAGMRERITSVGGRMRVARGDSGGVRVEVEVDTS